MVDLSMNRAVHLARRDAHYRLFVRILRRASDLTFVGRRRVRIQKILQHICEAHEEAVYALRGAKKTRDEKQFVKYLDFMRDGTRAALVMVQHEGLIREDKSFLHQFLGAGTELIGHFEKRHKRMLEESLEGMCEIVSRAKQSYRSLRKANLKQLSPVELDRYRKAYESIVWRGKEPGPRQAE